MSGKATHADRSKWRRGCLPDSSAGVGAMSRQAMRDFLHALAGNPALVERFRNVVEHHCGPDAIEGVARIAADAGHGVTVEDVLAFRSQALSALEGDESSDESANGVSGGPFDVDDLVIGGAFAVASAAFVTSDDLCDEVGEFFSKW